MKKPLIKSAVLKKAAESEDSKSFTREASFREFGSGKFIDSESTISTIKEILDFALSEIADKNPERTNDDRIDSSRAALAELMAITFKISNEVQAFEYIKNVSKAWEEFCIEAEEIHDYFQDEWIPHRIWARIAVAHNLKNEYQAGKRKTATLKEKLRSSRIEASFLVMKWGTFKKYLNPDANDWIEENDPEQNRTIQIGYI